ncbi:MAG: T9SS type A sorting domain-containing protein [Gilvibacter sp.]
MFCTATAFGQFEEVLISDDFDNPDRLNLVDIENDGDFDLVVSESGTNKYYLIKYDAPSWSFEDPVVMIDGDDWFSSCCVFTDQIHFEDINSDGLVDAVAHFPGLTYGVVASFLQVPTTGEFVLGSVLATSDEFTTKNHFLNDLNDDGNIDFVIFNDFQFKMYAQLNDGSANFATIADPLVEDVGYCINLEYLDIDLDGQKDFVGMIFGGIFWMARQTDDSLIYGEREDLLSGIGSTSDFKLTDIDGDTDLDVIFASTDSDQITWAENIDGMFNLGPLTIIGENLDYPRRLSLGDIDGDGLIDILATIRNDASIVWFKNLDGSGNYSDPIEITNSESLVYDAELVDVDADGDLDIVSVAYGNNSVKLFENMRILAIPDNEFAFSVYPNPAADILRINSTKIFKHFAIYNLLGQKVLSHEFSEVIDVSVLAAGSYYLELSTSDGYRSRERFVKM